jgi:sulfite exporter TauE/SafE
MSKQIKENNEEMVFGKMNYIFMVIGVVLIILGLVLLAGGGSKDPNIFNEEIFNAQRLKIAPVLMLLGFGLEIYAIMFKQKKQA